MWHFGIHRNCLIQLTIFQGSINAHSLNKIAQAGGESKAYLNSKEIRTHAKSGVSIKRSGRIRDSNQ